MNNVIDVPSFKEMLLNKEWWAIRFSEENETLKQLLMYCWNNGIHTLSCCVGHGTDSPFIVFDFNNENITRISVLLDNCLEDGISIKFNKGTYFNNNVALYARDYSADNFFEFLLNNINDMNGKKNNLYSQIHECMICYGANQEGFTFSIIKGNNVFDVSFRAYTDIEMDGIQDKLHNYLVDSRFNRGTKYWPLTRSYRELKELEQLFFHLKEALQK
jgi:arginine decarboxylase-like protein